MTDLQLAPNQLHRICNNNKFVFKNTSEIPGKETIFGQDRGTAAIEFGIDIEAEGYNLFVLGPAGTGRLTAVHQFIDEQVDDAPTPDDWCYVYNFHQPHKPIAIHLPAGQGARLQADMARLISTLQTELITVFEGDAYVKGQQQIIDTAEQDSQSILDPVKQMAVDRSFMIQSTPQGALMIMPMIDNQPITPNVFDQLPEETKKQLEASRRELEKAIENAFVASQAVQVKAGEALTTLRSETALQIINKHMAEVLHKYDLYASVIRHFNDVRNDILNSLEQVQEIPSDDANSETLLVESFYLETKYQISLLVENEPDSGAPVVLLDLPTYQNLVGRIEHEVIQGMLYTDFTHIKAGALHHANGGYLIVRAEDILRYPIAWDALKRALSRAQVSIEEPDMYNASVNTTRHIEPEPIDLDIKVVLVGSMEIYYLLHQHDELFRELFRVKADFVDSMLRTDDNEYHYAVFIATLCHKKELRHFDVDAVRRVVDYGSWLVSDQEKLSTMFGHLAPLIYESDYFAKKNGHDIVQVSDIEQAIDAFVYRNNQLDELSQERITRGTMFIDVQGEVVGQINGLVVISQGDYAFGLPSRVTARIYMGRKDVVQIDRESNLTGPIHDKGVLILQGYLGGRYAQDYPLTLTATLTFEQSYGGVEGDSAASTELYALLSALSGFPIRQDLGVTGSVNQHGQIQPIGGATQKIEGFFRTCKNRGLTGTQGVIIPASNVKNLVLSDEVVQAVKDKQFAIYAINTVVEGVALLTGKSIEEIDAAVDKKLRYFAETLSQFENRRA